MQCTKPLTLVACVLSTTAFAEKPAPALDKNRAILDQESFCGSVTFLEPGFRIEAESHLDASPDAVAAVLTDWDGLGHIMPMTKKHDVTDRRPDGARIRRELDAPFFMPDVWLLFDTKVVRQAESTKITYARVDGTPSRFDAVWIIDALDDGKTRVRYASTLEAPFDPPRFLLTRRQGDNAKEMFAALQAKAKAKSAKAPERCR